MKNRYRTTWSLIFSIVFITILVTVIGIDFGTTIFCCVQRQTVCDAICENGGVVVNAIYYRSGADTQLLRGQTTLIFTDGDLKTSYTPNEPHFFVELEVPVKNHKTYRVWAELPLSLMGEIPQYAILRFDKSLGKWQITPWPYTSF